MYNEFLKQLTTKQLVKLKKFQKQHKNCYAGAVGGNLSYIVIPTGLGELLSCKCICNKEINLTSSELF
jgi:hypothetical protein